MESCIGLNVVLGTKRSKSLLYYSSEYVNSYAWVSFGYVESITITQNVYWLVES